MKKPEKNSILKQSKEKRHLHKIWITLGVILIGSSGAYWQYSKKNQTAPTEPEIFTVAKKDLRSVVSSDGNIINPNIVNLSFFVNGTIEKILVKEGDKVEKGQILAELDKRDFQFDLQSAQNDVRIVNANIKSKQAELTDTDLKVAQNDLTTSKESLESTERDHEQKVTQALDSASINIEASIPEIETALQDIDDILGINNIHSEKTAIYAIFHNSTKETEAKNQHHSIHQAFKNFSRKYNSQKGISKTENVPQYLKDITEITRSTQSLLEDVVELIKDTRPTTYITESEIKTILSSTQSTLDTMISQVSTLTKARQAIDSSIITQKNALISAENSLNSTQTKFENSERNYEKAEVNKESSLSVLYAQLEQAKLKVEKAQYNLSLTTLTSPINGEIIQLNGNEGEAIKAESTSSENAFIKILSDANFTTEVYVEEIDIAQISLGQAVDITLDAIPDTILRGEVTFISSTATTDNNGIVTYLVRISITDPKDAPIREGMTTYVDFILGEANDVLAIPVTAIRRNRITMTDGSTREVKTGFSDESFIEITEGLKEGEKILLNPLQEKNGRRARTIGRQSLQGNVTRTLPPERIEAMKQAGFTDEELQKLQAGEFTDAMREKMQKMREAGGNDRGGFRGRTGGGFGR